MSIRSVSQINKAISILGSQRTLAMQLRALGCRASQALISKWVCGLAAPSCEHALAIERITMGKVKATSIATQLSKVMPLRMLE